VAVKAPVRQSCGFHNVGYSDSLKAMLAKQNAGNLNDLFPVCSSLLARHFHCLILSFQKYLLDIINDVRHE
jgi:hypothetical protein